MARTNTGDAPADGSGVGDRYRPAGWDDAHPALVDLDPTAPDGRDPLPDLPGGPHRGDSGDGNGDPDPNGDATCGDGDSDCVLPGAIGADVHMETFTAADATTATPLRNAGRRATMHHAIGYLPLVILKQAATGYGV